MVARAPAMGSDRERAMIEATAPVRVVSLASGSSGNALLIDAGHTRLVIDAGISARRIQQGLARLGLAVAHLDGILITHEHGDHITGLPVLARRGTPVTMTPGTARAVRNADHLSLRLIQRGGTIDIGRARVTALPVRHDASEPCGYVIEASGQTIAVFTDLGCPEPHLHEALRRADLIVLEANHDLDMLWGGRYPWPLKQRVASDAGHLCNDDCGALLATAIEDTRPRTVWLAHLSQDNNNEATARATVGARVAGRMLDVRVLPRHTPGPVWQSACLAQPSSRH
jgi:phosphoribosyl 1,2-cyclic phosphodiesterase